MVSYLFDNLGPWSWVTIGLVLMGLEMLAPGQFLLWLGVAAVATGAVMGLFGLHWQSAMLVFAALALVSVYLGRSLMRRRADETANDLPDLNRRAAALAGRTFDLTTAIQGGEGRVRVGDSSWRVVGPDLPAGSRVRVTRIEGATLVVEPVTTP